MGLGCAGSVAFRGCNGRVLKSHMVDWWCILIFNIPYKIQITLPLVNKSSCLLSAPYYLAPQGRALVFIGESTMFQDVSRDFFRIDSLWPLCSFVVCSESIDGAAGTNHSRPRPLVFSSRGIEFHATIAVSSLFDVSLSQCSDKIWDC